MEPSSSTARLIYRLKKGVKLGVSSAASLEIESLAKYHSFGKKELMALERDVTDLAGKIRLWVNGRSKSSWKFY